MLLFSHPEVKHGLTYDGIPQVNLDQLNPRLMFDNPGLPPDPTASTIRTVLDGGVSNYVTALPSSQN